MHLPNPSSDGDQGQLYVGWQTYLSLLGHSLVVPDELPDERTAQDISSTLAAMVYTHLAGPWNGRLGSPGPWQGASRLGSALRHRANGEKPFAVQVDCLCGCEYSVSNHALFQLIVSDPQFTEFVELYI